MTMIAFLIPVALLMGALGLTAFVWSLRTRQYEDLQGAAARILLDDDVALDDTTRPDQSGKTSR